MKRESVFKGISNKYKHIIQRLLNSIHQIDPSAEIILFGSRARGDARPDSDWDILILTDYKVDLLTERRFRNKIYDIELDTGEVFSVFIFSKKEWRTKQRITPFYHNVTKEGIRL